MKRNPLFVALTFVMSAAATAFVYRPAHAQDGIDKAKAAAFDKRLFAGPVGEKTYACFVRQYDGSHLTQHPKQKVSAMKLLVTAEIPPAEKTTSYQRGTVERRQIRHHRLDRADVRECAELVTDRQELAALRHK